MFQPKRMVTGKGWTAVCFIALLTIGAAIMFIAQPVVVSAEKLEIDVKGTDGKVKKIKILYDSTLQNVVATVDNNDAETLPVQQFPIEIKQGKRIQGIFSGPFIVFEGSTCICYPVSGGLRCVAYPPGTKCP
jgi:hypothetical protein